MMKGDLDARLAMGIVFAVLLGVFLSLGCARQPVSMEQEQGMNLAQSSSMGPNGTTVVCATPWRPLSPRTWGVLDTFFNWDSMKNRAAAVCPL